MTRMNPARRSRNQNPPPRNSFMQFLAVLGGFSERLEGLVFQAFCPEGALHHSLGQVPPPGGRSPGFG